MRTLQEERAGTGKLALRMDEREKGALMSAACQLDVHEYDDAALGKFAEGERVYYGGASQTFARTKSVVIST